MKRRIVTITALTVAVLGGAIGPVAAAWTVPGTGSGATLAGQLQPPAAAPITVTSAGTHLTWTAPSTGPAPAGYVVTRDGGIICTTASTTCDDTNLTPGRTYSYLVTSAAGSYWMSATPLTMTATTATGGFVLSAVSPSTVTAGFGLTFTVSATYGTGTTDAAYTGVHTLDIASSVSASPDGKASGGKVSPTFVAGVATKVATTLYGSGTQTLTVSDGSRTARLAITVSAAGASALELISATSNAVVCAPNGHVSIAAGKQLTARVAVVDPYGNLTSFANALTINLSYSGTGTLTPTSLTISSKTSQSSQSLTLTMPAGATKSGTLSISAMGTTLSTCSVN